MRLSQIQVLQRSISTPAFDQLTWGTLAPKLWRKAVPTIREINETTCTIVQTYEMTAKDAEDNTEYYNVEEYYRMRYSQSRVMLLDFERSAQEILTVHFRY